MDDNQAIDLQKLSSEIINTIRTVDYSAPVQLSLEYNNAGIFGDDQCFLVIAVRVNNHDITFRFAMDNDSIKTANDKIKDVVTILSSE